MSQTSFLTATSVNPVKSSPDGYAVLNYVFNKPKPKPILWIALKNVISGRKTIYNMFNTLFFS